VHRDDQIADIRTADDVAAKVREIYDAPLKATGVVHVTAVWRRPRGGYLTLAINQDTPESAHDAFVLNLTRARADAIVTTGKNLRAEPELNHDLQGPGDLGQALLHWRRDHLGKPNRPVTLVLTSGRTLDLGHRIFRSWTRPVIYTGREGGWRLESRAADAGVEVVPVAEPSLRAAVDFLRREFGAATVAIEAGPSTSRELYDDPLRVDELLLSVYEAPDLPQTVRGGDFLTAEDLARLFPRFSPPHRVRTGDGEWRFLRFQR